MSVTTFLVNFQRIILKIDTGASRHDLGKIVMPDVSQGFTLCSKALGSFLVLKFHLEALHTCPELPSSPIKLAVGNSYVALRR